MLTALEQGDKGERYFFFAEQGLFSSSQPRLRSVNPLGGEPLTGEPDAGDPHVRFGGRGDRVNNRSFLPLSGGRYWGPRAQSGEGGRPALGLTFRRAAASPPPRPRGSPFRATRYTPPEGR